MPETGRMFALVTNAAGFAGPPAVQALLDKGFHILAHDERFAIEEEWTAFKNGRQLITPISAAEPEIVIAMALEHAGHLRRS